MTFSTHIKFFLILTSASLVVSCKPSDADVHKLVEKTLDNMVFVKGGTFMMGDGPGTYVDPTGKKHVREAWTGYRDNKPAHPVELDSYYIQKYEVTYGEYDIFAKATGRPLPNADSIGQVWRQDNMAVRLDWFDARDYCKWIASVSNVPVNLPTEAQWEYAARSRGQYVPYATDNGWLEKGKNFKKTFSGSERSMSSIVGINPPNPLGIYEMQESAGEWVIDWHDNSYYKKLLSVGKVKNPSGPENGIKKVWRGGDGIGTPWYNTVFTRFKALPSKGSQGIRCVINTSSNIKQNPNNIR
jgi:formylglycine-generating enzyme required for sulfatase activity